MDEQELIKFEELLIKVADLPFPTWAEKREWLERHLPDSGLLALKEIAAWGWE